MKQRTLSWMAMAAGMLGVCAGLAMAQQPPQPKEDTFLKADSRAPYVHRINIYDEKSNPIVFKEDDKKPPIFSMFGTCSRCHDSSYISHGWHFNYAEGKDPGRPGEPWMLQDPQTRTYLPLSYRGWKGTYKPSAVGMNDFKFVTTYGSHLPGGGVGAPEKWASTQPANPKDRFHISGKLDVDCMICHESSGAYNFNERAAQIQTSENLRLAPAIGMNLGAVSGLRKHSKMMPSTWSITEAEKAGSELPAGPGLAYDHAKFEEGHTFFAIDRAPKSERCLYCHSNQPAVDRKEFWRTEKDVHMRANFECSTCHRNGLDHQTVRGYETEGKTRNDPFVSSLSCKGCHYGVEGASKPELAMGGKYGAPRPEHRGLPTVHLEKLSCTACHSGPFPGNAPEKVQTGLIHALGVSKAQKLRQPDTFPQVAQPIFLRGADGKIAPHKMVWPNFWARIKGNDVLPIEPSLVREAGGENLPKPADKVTPLTEEQISGTLESLTVDKEAGEPAYISGGKMYQRTGGKLVAKEHAAAEPYAWALGHDVRPKAQSLGARGCADCHSEQGAIYFAKVTALGPVDEKAAVVKAMHEMRGDDGLLPTLFAKSFIFRPMLKFVSFGVAIVIGAVLTLYGLRGLGVAIRRQG